MRLIDAHHHLWIPERTEPDLGYGWLRDIGAMKPFGDPTPIQRDYEWDEYVAESGEHELVGSVFVQTDGALPDPVAETAWVQSVFQATGLPHAIVALADLSAPDLDELLDRHALSTAFRGVRQILSRLDDDPARSFASRHLIRDPAWRDGFAQLERRGLSFDLQCYPEQVDEVVAVLERHPGTSVIIDHAGSPHQRDPAGLARWREAMTRLAQLPRTCVKLSGFGMFDPRWDADAILPLVAHLLERFGEPRLLFGSNFPVDRLMATFDQGVMRLVAALRSADPGVDLDRVLRRNAIDRYRLVRAGDAALD